MIEQLKNCPQCGGILNEAGRCEFCGSKVYDFLNIDFDNPGYPSAKTYIRIKNNRKIYIAPIIVNNVSIKWGYDCDPILYSDNRIATELTYNQDLDVNFSVVGDMYVIDEDKLNGT